MKKITSTEVNKNILMLKLIRISNKAAILNQKKLPPFNSEAAQLYLKKVFRITLNIESTYETLEKIIPFLKYPLSKKIKQKHKIEAYHHLRYHIENHYLRLASIYDQLLLLINDLYRLGIPQRKCSDDVILENTNIAETASVLLIKKLHKELSNVKATRNKIAHRGEFEHEDIEDLQQRVVYQQLYPLSKIKREIEDWEKTAIFYAYNADYIARSYRNNAATELEKKNQIIASMLLEIFQNVEPIFSKTFSQLNKKNKG